jgi:hypothetical protein
MYSGKIAVPPGGGGIRKERIEDEQTLLSPQTSNDLSWDRVEWSSRFNP